MLSDREGETAATRVAPRPRAVDQPAPVRRLEPQRYQTAGYAPPATAPVAPQRRSGRAARRFFAVLLVLALLAVAVVVAVVISTSTSNTMVQLRTTFSNDAHQALQQIQNLINQYTK